MFDAIARELVAIEPQAVGDGRYTIDSRSGGAKWFQGLSRSGRVLNIDHYETRRNARRTMQDSPLARAMTERMTDTVVPDTGLRLELTPVIEILGITREYADRWSRDAALRFHLWAADKRQHRSENLTFYQYQRLYAYHQQRDNDMFTRLYYDPDLSLQNPLQFESLDPDQIRGDALTSSAGFQAGADGINRDERGRETSYDVWQKQKDGSYNPVTIDARGPSGRLHMLHGYRPEYSGQGRGFTRLAHAIQEFENITDFSAATIKKAINQSCVWGFVEPAKDEDAVNPFEGILSDGAAGPAAQLFGSNPTPVEGVPVTVPSTGLETFTNVPEATLATPGSLFLANLAKGSTVKFAGNSAPADSYDTFVDAFAGYLSASTGVPLEVVLMKFGQNYSASRATLLLFWRVANGWASEMDSDLLSPVVEMWMSGEIAAGRIVAPGWSDPRLRAAWLCKAWVGSNPPDIDPLKTANANRINMEMSSTNLDRVSRTTDGSSAADNIEKNKRFFKDVPVAPWMKTGGTQDGGAGGGKDKSQAILEAIQDLLENGGFGG